MHYSQNEYIKLMNKDDNEYLLDTIDEAEIVSLIEEENEGSEDESSLSSYSLSDLFTSQLEQTTTTQAATSVDSVKPSLVNISVMLVLDMNHLNNSSRKLLRNLVHALILTGYSLIMTISLLGNCLYCHVICTTPKLRTTTNILILSMSLSDIITTLFNIPFTCARLMLADWPFPDAFCMLMPTIQVASVYVSTLSMAAIGIHRYSSVQVSVHFGFHSIPPLMHSFGR